MKLSYNWLKDYLEVDMTPQQIADAMTSIGIEVDGVEETEAVPGGLAGVVVAKVLTCEAHPDSDHLHITTVEDGTGEPLTVVCGAPNVAAGQKVLFARIGAVLPGDFKIKKSKIRGVESFGMICAEDELGIGTSHEGIMVLPEDAVVGTPAKEYLHLQTQAVIEYEITANRVDAASHWGVARDLYAYLMHNGIPCTLKRPDDAGFAEGAGKEIPVEVQDATAAPRYTGITLAGVQVKESPEWLQQKLLAIGLRPINNVVDISNFILFELGQPLHTFDAAKIGGGKVIVRRAKEGEKIVTLDGVERTLAATDIVIADSSRPMCIAGVFGGEDSGVSESTTEVFLESACFDAGSIRKTSKKHQLQTDASFRFERGADPEIAALAGRRAATGMLSRAGRAQGHRPGLCAYRSLRGTAHRPPNDREHPDLVELYVYCQVRDGRNGGGSDLYGRCVPRMRCGGRNSPDLRIQQHRPAEAHEDERERHAVAAAGGHPQCGLQLPGCQRFRRDDEQLPDQGGLLQWPGNLPGRGLRPHRESAFLGLECDAPDAHPQWIGGDCLQPEPSGCIAQDLRVWQRLSPSAGRRHKSWSAAPRKSGFFGLKGYLEALLKRYGADLSQMETAPAPADIFSEGLVYSLPGKGAKLAVMGTVNPALARRFGVKQPVFAAEIEWNTLFELVKRLLLDESVSYADLQKSAQRAAKKLLRQVNLFDVYRGDKIPAGKKQYALSFVLQDPERTLTDADVENTHLPERIRCCPSVR